MGKFEGECVKLIGREFRTFGGGRAPTDGNPIAAALQDYPLQFAAGVDVAEVVRKVLKLERRRVAKIRRKKNAGKPHRFLTRDSRRA